MTRLLLALALSTTGTVRDEGHCLDQRAFVLTEYEMTAVETELRKLRADVVRLKGELATSKRETAAALEGQAVCLVADCPPPSVCDCSYAYTAFAGAGVGALVCGSFWAGSRL